MRPCQSQEELGVHPTLLPRCILSIWKAPTLEGEGGGLAEGVQRPRVVSMVAAASTLHFSL